MLLEAYTAPKFAILFVEDPVNATLLEAKRLTDDFQSSPVIALST